MTIKDNLIKLILSDTFKDTQIVSLGALLNLAAGAIFFILAPRILGPVSYGLFSTVIVTGTLAATVANFGIDSGILKFAYGKNESYILSLAFKLYLGVGLTVGISGFIVSGFIAKLLGQPQITTFLKIAFASVILLLLSNYFVAALQAKRAFFKAAIVNLSSNVTRLFILAFIYFFAHLTLLSIILVYFLINIVSLIFGLFFARPNLKAKKTMELKHFALFNFWVAATIIISSLPLDQYLTLKLAGARQAGIYAAPFKLLTVGYGLGSALSRVFAPRYASFVKISEVINYSRKAIVFPLLLCFAFIILIFTSPLIVKIILGAGYLESTIVMRFQALGFIFFTLAIIPGAIILYHFGKSKISFLISVFATLIYVFSLYKLIPAYAANGAAAAFAINEFITFLLLSVAVLFYMNSETKK